MAVLYRNRGRFCRVFYSDAKAKLPIMSPDDHSAKVAWGVRSHHVSPLPRGGEIPEVQLVSGRWDKLFPRRVIIPVVSFLERDHEGHPHWINLVSGQGLQGVILECKGVHRVYVLTMRPEQSESRFNRWPVIQLL